MSLVPKLPAIVKSQSETQLFPRVNDQANKAIKYSFSNDYEKPYINTKHLKWLLEMSQNTEEEEAHEIFMNTYKKILQKDVPKESRKSLIPTMILKEMETKSIKPPSQIEPISELRKTHDIKNYIETIHGKKSEIVDPVLKKIETLKKLRKALKILPYERKESDNRKIFNIFSQIGGIRQLIPTLDDDSLMKLCEYATLEYVPSKNSPVFGNLAYYMILKGSVTPLSVPHILKPGTRLRPTTPEPTEPIELGIGESFGTLTELTNREITTRMFRVMTKEDHCEFLKISISDYIKLIQKLKNDKHEEKIRVIQNCAQYKNWALHSIEELISLLEWAKFPPNTILTSEGYRSPFIGFVQSGVCHVLRKVDVVKEPEGDHAQKTDIKQVVIGKLTTGESFGEISVIQQEPMTCSIVTESECRLGIISFEKISKLEDITRRLLLHSNNRTFAHLTQHEVHKQYIDQALKKEWIDFKNSVVQNVLDKYGIRKYN